MDQIITLGVIGIFIYLIYRKHKKNYTGTDTGKSVKKGTDREEDILEIMEILIEKLDILIARKGEKDDGSERST